MSTRCLEPNCPTIIPKGPRCPEHAAALNERRGYRSPRPWDRLRTAVLVRDDFACVHCHEPLTLSTMQCDHIVRAIDGGEATVENLQALCVPCHNAKTKREA